MTECIQVCEHFSFDFELALKNGIDSNPADFASLSVNAMKNFCKSAKITILYTSLLFVSLKIERDQMRHCFHWTACPLDWWNTKLSSFLPPILCRSNIFFKKFYLELVEVEVVFINI